MGDPMAHQPFNNGECRMIKNILDAAHESPGGVAIIVAFLAVAVLSFIMWLRSRPLTLREQVEYDDEENEPQHIEPTAVIVGTTDGNMPPNAIAGAFDTDGDNRGDIAAIGVDENRDGKLDGGLVTDDQQVIDAIEGIAEAGQMNGAAPPDHQGGNGPIIVTGPERDGGVQMV